MRRRFCAGVSGLIVKKAIRANIPVGDLGARSELLQHLSLWWGKHATTYRRIRRCLYPQHTIIYVRILQFCDTKYQLKHHHRWIKWYPTAPGVAYPHHSLSCNVVDGTQMLVMGGTFPNDTRCDVPSVFALHNLDLGKDNAEGAKWALFSPNKSSKYKVPSEIVSVIGGR